MWSDNETDRDFLNFGCVADTAAELIIQAGGQPLSLGVCGRWGVGKSSMLRLISGALKERAGDKFLFVDFNAWLYQGYDDAKAALMEVIAEKLVEHGKKTETGLDKALQFLKRVNWLRMVGITVGSALAAAAGVPPVGLVGAGGALLGGLADGQLDGDDAKALAKVGFEAMSEGDKLLKARTQPSPPQQIQALRWFFEEALKEMDLTLVVVVDDLDRCLPSTSIATLEAIRLFLFLPRTAFVVAADDGMIRQAVRAHFKGTDLDDDFVTNYFDKLVQIPLRVPPLGTQEVRAYLMLLFVERSALDPGRKESVRAQVCQRLGESWKGQPVDLEFILTAIGECPAALRGDLELAVRLAPLMTTSRRIAGNPRLIKRFLNTLSIRLHVANKQNVAVDEGALAKLLLFERCASEDLYGELVSQIVNGDQGKPSFLRDWETATRAGEAPHLSGPWDTVFVREWLALPPAFAEMDLRPVVYASREHLPIVTAADELSSEAAGLLEALLGLDGRTNPVLTERLRAFIGRETRLLMERLMVRARQEQQWGTPPVLWASLNLVDADPDLVPMLARFLEELPVSRLEPDIVPVLADLVWARPALQRWSANSSTSGKVRRAIAQTTRQER